MPQPIHATRRAFGPLRVTLLCGLLAATLTGVLAGPALADGHDHDRNDHGHYRQGHDEHGGWHRRGPPERYDGPRYQGYYRRPDVYYSAPPVVYLPPGGSLNFSIPLFR